MFSKSFNILFVTEVKHAETKSRNKRLNVEIKLT